MQAIRAELGRRRLPASELSGQVWVPGEVYVDRAPPSGSDGDVTSDTPQPSGARKRSVFGNACSFGRKFP